MQIIAANNSDIQPQFKAKFLKTPALEKVVQWAVENGKFDKLNAARKQIDYSATKIRIHMNLAVSTEGFPIAIFRRYSPKNGLENSLMYENDFLISKPIIYEGKDNTISPLEYGYKLITQMGQYVTRNQIFKNIVVHPPSHTIDTLV